LARNKKQLKTNLLYNFLYRSESFYDTFYLNEILNKLDSFHFELVENFIQNILRPGFHQPIPD